MQKGFSAVLILLALALIIVVGLAVYLKPKTSSLPTPVNTIGWITYTNQAYDYSFSYPPEWKTEEYTNDLSGIKIMQPDNNSESIMFTVHSMPLYVADASKFDIELNGYPATKWANSFYGITLGNNRYLHISLISNENNEVLNTILSTFKMGSISDTPAGLKTNISPNQLVSSPLTINGTIPAGWMFEASFPITILDQDKNVITQGFGSQIEGENWMSGNPVKFESTVSFKTTATNGFVRLAKDNPSGLPENDASYDIPVKF